MNLTAARPSGALDPAADFSAGNEAPPSAPLPALEATRLAAQCAQLLESPTSACGLRPLLDLLRKLLNAHAVAWLENPARSGQLPDTISGMRTGAGAALVALRGSLDPQRATAAAAPLLGADSYTLAAPIVHEGTLCGWLVAQMPIRNPRDLQAFLVLLQMAGGYLLYGEQRRQTAALVEVLERASGLLEIFRQSGAELDFDHACRQAVDTLREELGCFRVYLAFKERGRLRLRAISGLAKLDTKSIAHEPVEAALREALHHGANLDWTPATPRRSATAANTLLAESIGATRLLTLLIGVHRGALLLAWSGEAAPATVEEHQAVTAAAAFVPTLFHLLQRARPHPFLFSLHRGWAGLTHRRKRLAVALVLAGVALLAAPFHYTLHVGCRLAPVTKQVIAAPFQAQLKRSLVRPGDHVEAGQALGELDSRELKLKEAELLAARERALKQRDRSLANTGEGSDFAAAQVANFEAQSVGEDLALVQRKLSMLRVVAPLAGTVVSGDLRRTEGQPVQQGQVLWEVAPLEEMIVELEVPDRDVAHVREGQPVRVRLEALSEALPPTALQRLHPQSEPSEGLNVFIGEAPVHAADRATVLRPGMRGRAAVETAREPLIWILGHRLGEWLLTTLLW